MLMNLLTGLSTMVFCLLLQALLSLATIHYYRRHSVWLENATFARSLALVGGVMLLLVVGNLGQIAIWAWLFMLLEEFEQFANAFYHSTVNFSSLGYGDIAMSEEHRLLDALETVNGVLMIGVSTAMLMTVIQDTFRRTLAK